MTLYLPVEADLFVLLTVFATFRMWGRGIALMLHAYDDPKSPKSSATGSQS